MFVLAALFLTLTTTGLSNALQRARSSEKSLKESNRSLQENLAELARREEELRESDERFRVLFEHAPDPFFFLRTDGALVGGNKAGQQFTGYKDGELIDRNILEIDVIAPGDLPKAAIILQQSRNGEPTGPDEIALSRKDGAPVYAELSTHPVNIKGEQFVLCVARDITDRKQGEQENKRLEALELFKTQPDRFDLVITDMTMPSLTGDKLAREMMDIRSDIPVILCTGFSARMSETVALDLGIRAFVTKPILMHQIAQTIRKVLDEGSG